MEQSPDNQRYDDEAERMTNQSPNRHSAAGQLDELTEYAMAREGIDI